MKTLHRKMFESLPYETFKEFCRAFNKQIKAEKLDADYSDICGSNILYNRHWLNTPQGFEYWASIYERLLINGK